MVLQFSAAAAESSAAADGNDDTETTMLCRRSCLLCVNQATLIPLLAARIRLAEAKTSSVGTLSVVSKLIWRQVKLILPVVEVHLAIPGALPAPTQFGNTRLSGVISPSMPNPSV
jgi:hypothetical protein